MHGIEWDPPVGSAAQLLARQLADGGQRPYLTYRDTVTGERTELGYATFENWVAKTADAFVEEGVEPGDVVTVATAGHWTGPIVVWACGLLGATARLVPGDGAPGRAGQAEADMPRFGRADRVAVVHEDLSPGAIGADATLRLTVGAGLGGRPLGDADAFVDVALSGADVYDGPAGDLDRSWLLVPDRDRWARLTQRNVLAAADVLTGWGLASGERLLVTLPMERTAGAVPAIAALAVGAAMVVVRGGDAGQWLAIAEEEHANWLLTDAAGVGGLGRASPGDHGLSGVVSPEGAAEPAAALAATRLGVEVAVGSGLPGAGTVASLTPRGHDPATAAWLAAEPGRPAGAVLPPAYIEEREGELHIDGPVASPGPEGGPDFEGPRGTGVAGELRHGPDDRPYVFLTGDLSP